MDCDLRRWRFLSRWLWIADLDWAVAGDCTGRLLSVLRQTVRVPAGLPRSGRRTAVPVRSWNPGRRLGPTPPAAGSILGGPYVHGL